MLCASAVAIAWGACISIAKAMHHAAHQSPGIRSDAEEISG